MLRCLKQAQPQANAMLLFFLTGVVAKAFDRGVGALMQDFRVIVPLPVAVWAQTMEKTLAA